MVSKRIVSKFAFVIGAGNLVLFLGIYGLGCLISGGSCSGDSMGGLMTMYALTLFLPQLLIFIFFSCYFLIKAACVLRPNIENRPSTDDWKKIATYFLLAIFVVFIDYWRLYLIG